MADVPELIYNKILITKDDIAGFQNIKLAWGDNTAQGNTVVIDQMTVISYCKELNSFAIFEAAAESSTLATEVSISCGQRNAGLGILGDHRRDHRRQ